ncbi:MAG: peptidase C11 [Firmicutes bacterium]|nr:peptidase C11 [Bacillota bacterium]
MDNRPRGREKHISGTSQGVFRRGESLGGGPVGKRKGSSGRGPEGGGGSPFTIILIILALIFGGGGGMLSGLFSDDSSPAQSSSQSQPQLSIPVAQDMDFSEPTTTAQVDVNVANGARDKYTTIKGNKKDQTTIMVYMCGTDLESRSGMATNDLKEMAKAASSDQVNLVIYTGGCAKWQIRGISNQVNQIYQVKDGQLMTLESNMGAKSMTDPNTLTEFIKYATKKFPANRYDLIMWDHGSGSINGYGYDQNYQRSGSMTLSKMNQALKNAGTKFDFIGFDACLMATAETASMLKEHADYMIASEEVEPGIGWYYTPWLEKYVKNPSMDTLSIGKNIIDSYVEECARRVGRQGTTLSIVDLAEFDALVPSPLKNWSKATSERIQKNDYKSIAQARHNTREFNQSKIDQCDFVDFLKKMDTKESKSLAQALLSSIKYNRTSSNMSNAYGLSIYFPNKKPSNVSVATQINNDIGLEKEFNSVLKDYASLQIAGQTVAQENGNTGNPYSSLFGQPISSGTSNQDETAQILQSLFYSMLSGRDRSGMTLDEEETTQYIAENQFDASQLVWKEKNGKPILSLSEEQWSLVTELEKNTFVDDGSGFIDLGCDNTFEFDKNGNLVGESEPTWLAINEQPVAYYHASTVYFSDDNYSYKGYVPAILNGERVDLLIVFDQDNPSGYIAGSIRNYDNMETETVSKVDRELQDGDVLEFICDYYDYNGQYQSSYRLGNAITVKTDKLKVSDVYLTEKTRITYKITDIYSQEYWTPALQ